MFILTIWFTGTHMWGLWNHREGIEEIIMNVDTGKIYVLNEEEGTRNLSEFREVLAQKFEDMDRQEKPLVPIEAKELETLQSMSKSARKNWMRNKPCPCESGKKFKRCCWDKFTG